MSWKRTLLFCLLIGGSYAAFAQEAEWNKVVELDSLGEHQRALKILDRLVQQPEWRYRSLMMRSGIYFEELKRIEDAFVDIAAAMKESPDSIGPYLNRSSMYMNMNMTDRALSDLDQGLLHCHSTSDSASILLNMGSAFLMSRQFDKALNALDQAITLEPDQWGTQLNKAALLAEIGRTDEAHALYVDLHEAHPDDLVIMNNMGFLALRLENFPEAITWFTKALEVKADDAVVMNNLGYAQFREGDTEAALTNVQRSIELYPSNSYAYRNLGLIQQSKGLKNEACTAFEAALRLGFTQQYGPEVEDLRKTGCR